MLDRNAILEVQDLKVEEVKVESWGGTVLVQELTAEEATKFGASFMDKEGNRDMSRMDPKLFGKLAVACLVNEDRTLMFGPKDVDRLCGKGMAALQDIAEVCFRLSGMSEESVAEVKG